MRSTLLFDLFKDNDFENSGHCMQMSATNSDSPGSAFQIERQRTEQALKSIDAPQTSIVYNAPGQVATKNANIDDAQSVFVNSMCLFPRGPLDPNLVQKTLNLVPKQA